MRDGVGRDGPMVLVIAYRADNHLAACLAEFDSCSDIHVVDNDASPTTRDLVERAGAHYLPSVSNLGFAAGVNLGLVTWWDGRRDVLLLNPDARITWDGVQALQSHLHQNGQRLAAVGPLLVDDSGAAQRADWPLPSPGQLWCEAVGAARWWRGRRFVVGAVLLLRGEALAEVGGFDERYFLYAEEADWQCAVQRAGWSVAVDKSVAARHAGGASSSNSELREQFFHSSAELFARKWYGSRGWLLMRMAAIFAAARRCIVGGQHGRSLARRTLRRYLTGPVKSARIEAGQ